MSEQSKIGIISCSGEEIAAGTISRLATRRVLELLRPASTVTLCLPLFLAGEEMERRFAREHPTITVDGCDKLCARRGTEKYSGRVAASLVVADILKDGLNGCSRSLKDSGKTDETAVWIVADKIAAEVDRLLESAPKTGLTESDSAAPCACSCGSPAPAANLLVNGKTVSIDGLPLIFEHLRKQGLQPNAECADKVMKTVRIYHAIDPAEEVSFCQALASAYNDYCLNRTKTEEREK
jgi:uncharacterized metal-binding protein